MTGEVLRFAEPIRKALALSGDRHELHHVLAEVERGHAQVHSNEEGIIVTTVCDDTAGRHVYIWLAGGRLEAVLALTDDLYEWARSIGAYGMTFNGRKGWGRALAEQGWEPQPRLVTYCKEL